MSGLLSATLSGLNSDSYCEFSTYRDQQFKGSRYLQEKTLKNSCTLYVGNLSFYTTEEQIHELFSKCGDVKRIVMGLDKVKKTPCGFCFVEYYTRAEAEHSMRFINGTRLDDRIIRTDWDAGFKEGRQYGRGKSGGQIIPLNSYIPVMSPISPGFSKAYQAIIVRTSPVRIDLRQDLEAADKVRDEYRIDYDVGRGGFGKIVQQQKMNQQTVIY